MQLIVYRFLQMEHLHKESEDAASASVTSTPDNDALVKALGKKDYGGYVKTLGRAGVGVGHKAAFGKVTKRESQSKIQSLEETIEVLKSQIDYLYSTIGAPTPTNKINADVDVASLNRAPQKKKVPEQVIIESRAHLFFQ